MIVNVNVIQAQQLDSLWNVFNKTLNEIVQQEQKKAYALDYFDDSYSSNTLINIIINSPIEEQGIEYMFQKFRRDSLPNIRDFVCKIFLYIAQHSNSESSRKIAMKYNFSLSLNPDLSGLKLEDFDDTLKQKLLTQFTRKFTEEELSFFAESYVKYWMIHDKELYEHLIEDTMRRCQDTILYEDAKKIIFDSEVSKYKQKIQNEVPSYNVLIDAAQLNILEVIPYLKQYTIDEKYGGKYREYSIYALTIMGVDGYLTKAIEYFSVDYYQNDTDIAGVINNQDIWYAYLHRILSDKYIDKCPVAYRTIEDLNSILKDFPITDRPWYEGMEELPNGMKILIPSKVKPIRIVPEGCGLSIQRERVPINPNHIKVVVDWMETNKGKYELQQKIDRTF